MAWPHIRPTLLRRTAYSDAAIEYTRAREIEKETRRGRERRDIVMISHPARRHRVFARAHVAPERRSSRGAHFSSDLTLIALSRHSSSLALPRSLSSHLLSLWHHHSYHRHYCHLLLVVFLPRFRSFFLVLPWHAFRAKKTAGPTKDGKRKRGKERDGEINLLFWSGLPRDGCRVR